MKLVEAYVAKKQAEFSRHAFFADQQLDSGLWGVLSFAPDLTFWVMAFQDILRLNSALTQDPKLRKIVRHHQAEDAGHERWFLDDLAAMQIPVPDVRWLFSKRHSPTRDAAYQLLSEVYRTNDDRMRLVLITTLESAGHVFFGRIAEIVERAGWTKALKYFSFSHLEVEKNHQVFEAEIAGIVSGIKLEAKARNEAKQLVDRCYAAFTAMFDSLCAMADPARRVPVTPQAYRSVPAALRAKTPELNASVAKVAKVAEVAEVAERSPARPARARS